MFGSKWVSSIPAAATKARKHFAESLGGSSSESQYFNRSLSRQPILKLLRSNKDSEKLEGMKTIIAMLLSGKNVSDYMPDVVNIVTENIHLKRLIYYFLIYTCESGSSEILMSINSFHKDLTDGSALIRASALRAISSMRIEEILPILLISIQRAVNDFSIYVRKAACLTLLKLSEMEDVDNDTLIAMVQKLIADNSMIVVGPAIHVMSELCPDRLDFLHASFRRICREIENVEMLYLPSVIDVLMQYARAHLDQGFVGLGGGRYNPDLKLLLASVFPLLHCSSPAVKVSIATLYLNFNFEESWTEAAKALLSFKDEYDELAYVMLATILEFVKRRPAVFHPFLTYFYIGGKDSFSVARYKMDIISYLASDMNIISVIKELMAVTRNSNSKIASHAITTIGLIALRDATLSDICAKNLIILLRTKVDYVAAESIVVLRKLITKDPVKYSKVITHCAKISDSLTVPRALASSIWIIGHYCDKIPTLAVENFRKLVLGFREVEDQVKCQVLNMGLKLVVKAIMTEKVKAIFEHLLQLSLYDQSVLIRDKARLFKAIYPQLESSPSLITELEDAPLEPDEENLFMMNTISFFVNSKVKGYAEKWENFNNYAVQKVTLEQDTSELRDEETVPELNLPQSDHYSSADTQNIGDAGLKIVVGMPSQNEHEDFLADSDEEAEDKS